MDHGRGVVQRRGHRGGTLEKHGQLLAEQMRIGGTGFAGTATRRPLKSRL
ncbi:hypothetical protein [Mycobacterium senriense]|nr:hypothetical protein [Mycobacterium senriense]